MPEQQKKMTWQHWVGVPFRLFVFCIIRPFDFLMAPGGRPSMKFDFVKYGVKDP